MIVGDIMTRASLTETDADPLTAAASRMWREQTGSLLVMTDGRLAGIITERDVMKAVARGLDLGATPISAVMTTAVLTVTAETPLSTAARHMSERWIRHLPVVDAEGAVIGMVSQRDLCGVLADSEELTRDRRLARLEP